MTGRARAACIAAVTGAVVVGTIALNSFASSPPAALTHDAYIWQRRWTPALDQAAQASASHVAGWRVLGAEIDGRGRLLEFSPHLDILARAGRPVTMVVRINGQVDAWDQPAVAQQGLGLVQRWRDAGVDVTGLEIDHDCPTAGLRRYAAFLALLRQARPANLALSITALPAWLDGDGRRLAELLRQVDLSVLQVHAVRDPRLGLFDGARAAAWAKAWSAISPIPFRIALPTYGSRVTWSPSGRIAAIASEAPAFGDPDDSRELFATPREIVAFLDALRRDPPAHLVGIAWFRLPTSEDERAWSLDTWHAVMEGVPLRPEIQAAVEPHAAMPGLYDVFVSNRGDVEDAFPSRVTITATAPCDTADAIAPYAMQRRRDAIDFQRVAPRLLPRHGRTLIGWVRCPSGAVRADAQS